MTMAEVYCDSTKLLSMYRMMVLIRRFEERVADIVEQGTIPTPCHFCIGQEAAAVGVCEAIERQDYIFGAHRSHGHYLAKGGNVRSLMAEIFCRETGCSRGRGGSMHVCAPEVGVMGTVPIVAATIPIAVGAGLAAKLRGEDRVSVTFFGDGATEEGHFHESLNLAGVYRLPILFVCENNLYSSHMGIAERRLKDNIPDSGAAHGIPSVSVDGNDVLAVYRATAAAAKRGRAGEGPTLLELRTFRWRGHVGPSHDLDVGVKRSDELREWLKRDAIARFAEYLCGCGFGHDELQQIRDEVEIELTDAIQFAERSPYPDPVSILEHVFSNTSGSSAYASA